MGEASPGISSGQPTPAGVPIAASAMRLDIDKSICHGNHVLVRRFVSKLEQTAPVPILTLHKMRVGIHDQQPASQPLVDAELKRRFGQAIDDCGDDEEDKLIQISLYISELELMRSRLGDPITNHFLRNYSRPQNFQRCRRIASLDWKIVRTS
ncbi:hypothetical protein SARC_00643 [Sphaeroforma arctica JP610]|uniref:Uncharacterized protein n=1 Tax=Sphaeroforma arctica JP610 TaxID=667725 RepID=A0A0L0GE05_9EUKA|nr:hypothetical protein SARC_00643 [Sphaeroforma arctica JP610]KNC87257.1 hypothetical protein SARC_00643 [Sphaeroforma arctica JP610]|eukprot:XP_014161159.1 hypothetical protein SARC_00643 [Sphaeroforma arctica JP610]